jgi:hypothetical protein
LRAPSRERPVLAVCVRPVSLPNVALSLIAMTTVTMSPTSAMRWSVNRLADWANGAPGIGALRPGGASTASQATTKSWAIQTFFRSYKRFSACRPRLARAVDNEAATIGKLVPLSDLQDPKKLLTLTERFTAMYDLTYGPSSGSSSSLTVASNGSSPIESAASTILGGIISSNGASIAGSLSTGSSLLSNQLLTSIQGLSLGG